jgi:hypothetical protein
MFQNCGSSIVRFSAKRVYMLHIKRSLTACWNNNQTYKNDQTQPIAESCPFPPCGNQWNKIAHCSNTYVYVCIFIELPIHWTVRSGWLFQNDDQIPFRVLRQNKLAERKLASEQIIFNNLLHAMCWKSDVYNK